MTELFNIYCDESCHLENDHQKAMVLGGVWCPKEVSAEATQQIRDIQCQHGLSPFFEIKWSKVSRGKSDFYLDVVRYFLMNQRLHFRALIVPNKSVLDHASFGQTHDQWYYKMYFDLLKVIIHPVHRYHIYLDIKDTRGGRKVANLKDVLARAKYDFSREIVERIQIVRSHEVKLMQLADLLIGAVSHVNRQLSGNVAKEALVAELKSRSGYSLTATTLLREEKLNLFRWHASEARQ